MSDESANLPENATSEQTVDGQSQAMAQKRLSFCGAMLTEARENREWSVQYVADQLKLSTRQIVWLEANQFEHLPTPVVIRGFVRSYAKLLKIDAEPLIALLPGDASLLPDIGGFKPTLTTPFQQSRLPMLGHQDGNNGRYIWGAVVFVVLAAGFFALQQFEKDGTLAALMQRFSSPASDSDIANAASEAASVSEAMNLPIPVTDSSVAQTSEATATSVSELDASAAFATSSASSVSATFVPSVNAQSAASIAVASSASTAKLSSASSAAAVSSGVLRLKFRQDSWIQVKRENGEILNSHLAKAGTEEFIDVKETLQIRIGNAAGVDAVLRGAPLAIAGVQGSNVANIVVK
jgi:cytoskeleton protein RodZ